MKENLSRQPCISFVCVCLDLGLGVVRPVLFKRCTHGNINTGRTMLAATVALVLGPRDPKTHPWHMVDGDTTVGHSFPTSPMAHVFSIQCNSERVHLILCLLKLQFIF